jgi:predicted phosphohydrolase
MQISVISDIHLEFGPLRLPGGEVLVLAGDACELRSLQRDNESQKSSNWTLMEERLYRHQRFFEVECAKYDKVIYVMGNHEHYHGRWNSTESGLRALLPSNVVLLEKQSYEIGDVLFVGGTLWTDMNRGNPITAEVNKSSLNDYKHIKVFDSLGEYRGKLRPAITMAEHAHTLKAFAAALDAAPDKKCVVVSHHAPCHLSIAPQYANYHHENGGYYSDLSNFILDRSHIVAWIHGHMHNASDYMLGSTRVISNPRGYVGHERLDTDTYLPAEITI